MNHSDPFVRQLEAYLVEYEGPTPLPDAVRDAVRAQLPTTKQVGPTSGPVRDIYMHSSMDAPARWALAAAVVIGAVIIGGALMFGGGVGNPPAPTPLPSAEPSTAGGLPEGSSFVLSDGLPEEGRPTVPMTVTIPAPGWYGDVDGERLEKGANGADPPDGAGLIVWAPVPANSLYVYGDACQWVITRPSEPAATVDAAMTALAGQASQDASALVDITLDGYTGKSITLHVPDGADASQCDNGTFSAFGLSGPLDPGRVRYDQDPGQIDEVWILDVDGQFVVIARAYHGQTPQTVVDELETIVESTTFE